jgi:hypothetical protein
LATIATPGPSSPDRHTQLSPAALVTPEQDGRLCAWSGVTLFRLLPASTTSPSCKPELSLPRVSINLGEGLQSRS